MEVTFNPGWSRYAHDAAASISCLLEMFNLYDIYLPFPSDAYSTEQQAMLTPVTLHNVNVSRITDKRLLISESIGSIGWNVYNALFIPKLLQPTQK